MSKVEFSPTEKYLKVIRGWQLYWMTQEDSGYPQRALGVDANMKHDLARRLVEAEQVPNATAKEG